MIVESRRLEVRCGIKAKDQVRKVYVHMLNGTLCATERALCCLVENYQTPDVGFAFLFLLRCVTDRKTAGGGGSRAFAALHGRTGISAVGAGAAQRVAEESQCIKLGVVILQLQ